MRARRFSATMAVAGLLSSCGQSPSASAREKLEEKVAEFEAYASDYVEYDPSGALESVRNGKLAVFDAEAKGDELVWRAIFTARGNASVGGANAVSLRACVVVRMQVEQGRVKRIRHDDITCPPDYEHLNRFGPYEDTVALY